MTDPSPDKQKQLAVRIASTANATEKEALRLWIERLLEIKASDLPAAQKAKQQRGASESQDDRARNEAPCMG